MRVSAPRMLELGFQALKNKHTNFGIWKSISMELAGVLKTFGDCLAEEVSPLPDMALSSLLT